ncbi:MAG: hypothetical protein MK180_17990 [Rhodobacteraceae bacterium]|nr:hypothetical protein [Paracoccaceae bacterium]
MIAMLWAGTLLGGSFVAAPAKFTVETLTTAELLAVGRAQFHALAVAEYALAFVLAVTLIWLRPKRWWLGAVPLVILAARQIVTMPALDARTIARIAGEAVEGSHLHLVYVALEVAKTAALIGLAFYWRRDPPA